MNFKPFVRIQRLLLQTKKPVGVYLLNENLPIEQSLPLLRRSFRGTWYFLIPRMIRVKNEYIRNKLTDFNWLKKLKFHPILTTNFRNQKNAIYNISQQFNLIKQKYPFIHRIYFATFINNMYLFKNRENMLLYTLDLNEPAPTFRNSIMFRILYWIKKELQVHDDFKNLLPKTIIFSVISGSKTFYIPVIIDGDYSNLNKVFGFLRRIFSMVKQDSQNNIEVEIENKINFLTKKEVIDSKSLSNTILNTIPDKVKKQKEITGDINVSSLVVDISSKVISTSVKNTPKNIESKNRKKIKDSVTNIVPSKPIKGNFNSPTSRVVNNNVLPIPPNTTVQNFSKYESTQIENILLDILKVYENSELGLKVIDTKIEDLPIKDNEISKSILKLLSIKFQDNTGKIHNIRLKIPKVLNDGSYFVYGNKYICVKQIYPIPIVFPKPGVGRYSSYTISFLLQKMRYFSSVFLSGYKIPIGIVLCYYFGFKETMSKYNIKWYIHKESTKDDDILVYKLNNGEYLWIHNKSKLSPMQLDLVESLFKFKYLNEIKSESLTKEYFKEFLELYTGNDRIPEKIIYLLNMAIDKRTYNILKEKGLPLTLFDIFVFMHKNILDGFVTDRNSLIDSRIRSHEAIAQITFDVLRSNITSYFYQTKYKNKNAKLDINPDSVLSAIITSSSFQLMEYVNPLEEIMQHYKVTYSGYNGIPKDSVSDKIRAVHESAYGTIDPIDVPLGGSIGVVQHLTMAQSLTLNGSVIPKDKTDDLLNSILSLSTASIPFVSKNEPTRVMMGSNQSRQTVPLKDPHIPLIQTGIESIIPNLLNSNIFLDKSPVDGIITYVSKDKIEIKGNDGKIYKIDIKSQIARSGQGYSAYIEKYPIVKKGQKVKSGTIIAESNAIKNGTISYGRNLVTTYMFWEGYNFEDGIVLLEDIRQDFTSSHVIKLVTFVDEQDRIIYINPKLKIGTIFESGEEIVKVAGSKFLDLLDEGVINEENLLIFGNKYKLVAPYKCEIKEINFYLSGIDKSQLSTEIINKLNELGFKTNESYYYKGKKYKGVFIDIKIKFDKPLDFADKMTNRHASKGVSCLFVPKKEMPKLKDGRVIECIINPLSFINRTNVGQEYELYCGEISYQLLQRMIKLPRKKFLQILGKVMYNLDKHFYGSSIYNFLSRCNEKVYKQFLEIAKKNRGLPLLIPPFKEPTYKEILKAMEVLNIPQKYDVIMPDGTTKKIPVGLQYILKLEHMSSHKIFSRGLGPYQRKTGQPTQGKVRGGGQRVGEGDVWSFMSWDAENLMNEFFSGGSDDFRLKQQMYREILDKGSTSVDILKYGNQQSKDYLDIMFKGIMLQI